MLGKRWLVRNHGCGTLEKHDQELEETWLHSQMGRQLHRFERTRYLHFSEYHPPHVRNEGLSLVILLALRFHDPILFNCCEIDHSPFGAC